MKRIVLAGVAIALLCVPLRAADDAKVETAAISATVEAYVAAFNKGDAAALSALWTEQGEIVNPAGELAQGREQIQKQFADYFAAAKNAKLELADTKIELQSPSSAIETGLARVIVPDAEPSETKYKAVHIKTAAGWKIDSVRETEVEAAAPTHYEQLQDLAWLIGEWTDASEAVSIESSCRWSRNQNFLIQSFRVVAKEGVDFEGTQIIGWDPQAQAIRSWLFDSDGGFGSGRWTQGEGQWTVRTLQVLPDGRVGSATNVYELIDDTTIQYRSIGRQVEGELLPSVGPVKIVRKN